MVKQDLRGQKKDGFRPPLEGETGLLDLEDSDGALFALSLGTQGRFDGERTITLGDDDVDEGNGLFQLPE